MGYFDGLADAYSTKRKSRAGSPPTLAELSERVDTLSMQAEELGAPGIEQDRPGVFRTIVDLLSRPNYAIAGFAEELAKDRSVTGGVTRALSEIFSGVGSIQGEKRAFGEVLENLGVGTKTLADAFPALEGTWVGNFGSRGAAGLALDIVTDPLTYLTGGAARGAVRVLTKKGEVALSAKGAAVFDDIFRSKRVDDIMGRLAKGGADDPFKIGFTGQQLKRREVAEKLFERTYKGGIPDDLLDAGGMRWMGKTIVRGDTISSGAEKIAKAIKFVPGGEYSLSKAEQFGSALKRGYNQAFGSFDGLENLPQELRPAAIRLHRQFTAASGAHRARVRSILENGMDTDNMSVAPDLARRYIKEQAADPDFGRKLYEIREGTKAHILKPEQQQILDEFVALHDSLGADLIGVGVFDDGQLLERYFHHSYTEESLKNLDRVHARLGSKFQGHMREVITKHRPYATYKEAEDVSRELNRLGRTSLSKGELAKLYPVLVPEYDLLKNFNKYIDQYADLMARKAWHEEATLKFGKVLPDADKNLNYASVTGRGLSDGDRKQIDSLLSGFSPKASLSDESGKELARRNVSTHRSTVRSSFRPSEGLQGRKIADIDGDLSVWMRGGEFLIVRDAAPLLPGDLSQEILGRFHPSGKSTVLVLSPELRGKGYAQRLMEIADSAGADVEKHLRSADNFTEAGSKAASRFMSSRGIAPDLLDQSKARETLKGADKLMPELSEDGRRELVGQLLERTTSDAQKAGVFAWAREKWAKYLPDEALNDPFAGLNDDTLLHKMYGNKAKYVPREGGIWGEKPIMIPEIIARDIERINSRVLDSADYKEFTKLIDSYHQANNIFKWFNYAIWPASHARNAYSNVAQSFLDIGVGAMNPKLHMETVAIMAGKNLAEESVGGYTRAQLRQMSRDLGVWVPGRTFVETTGRKKLGKATGKLADLAGAIENEGRIQLWINNINRGIHPHQAADHVGEFFFHYNELSQIEKKYLKSFVPFYTWTRKNIALQVKSLRRTPGRIINQIKPFRGQSDENDMMVQWEAEGLKIRLDRDGKTVRMLTGIDLPLRNLDNLWRGDLSRTGRGLMGMVTPIVKTVPEILLNRDFFLGRDLDRTQSGSIGRLLDNSVTPKAVKDWLGYKKVPDEAGRPNYSFDGKRFTLLFRSWVFSRAVSTTDRQFRDNMREGGFDWQRVTLDLLSGIRYEEFDMDIEMQRKISIRVKQLEESLKRRGVLTPYQRLYESKRDAGAEFR